MSSDLFTALLLYTTPVLFVFWMIRDAGRSPARPTGRGCGGGSSGAIPQLNQEDLGDGLFPGGLAGTG